MLLSTANRHHGMARTTWLGWLRVSTQHIACCMHGQGPARTTGSARRRRGGEAGREGRGPMLRSSRKRVERAAPGRATRMQAAATDVLAPTIVGANTACAGRAAGPATGPRVQSPETWFPAGGRDTWGIGAPIVKAAQGRRVDAEAVGGPCSRWSSTGCWPSRPRSGRAAIGWPSGCSSMGSTRSATTRATGRWTRSWVPGRAAGTERLQCREPATSRSTCSSSIIRLILGQAACDLVWGSSLDRVGCGYTLRPRH